MLILKKDIEEPGEWDPILIVGTYSDESNILSYKLDVLRNMDGKISLSVKTFKRFEKKYNDAVTCLEFAY